MPGAERAPAFTAVPAAILPDERLRRNLPPDGGGPGEVSAADGVSLDEAACCSRRTGSRSSC